MEEFLATFGFTNHQNTSPIRRLFLLDLFNCVVNNSDYITWNGRMISDELIVK
jgi:hypothetical protein